MTLSWKLVALTLGIFAGLVFLVYEGKIDGAILDSLVSALVGGGMLHAGSKLYGGDKQE